MLRMHAPKGLEYATQIKIKARVGHSHGGGHTAQLFANNDEH